MSQLPDVIDRPAPVKYPDFYEVINGVIKETPPMGIRQTTVGFRLAYYLAIFAEPKQLGQAVTEGLFHLRDDCSERRPDVAFVSAQRWPFDLEAPEGNAWPVVPDIAVEVISPSNTYDEIRQKMKEYFEAGVRLVWIVSAALREIEVFTPQDEYRRLGIDSTLTAEPVIPGFTLRLRDLFSKRTS